MINIAATDPIKDMKKDPGAWIVLKNKGKFSILKRDDGLWDFAGGHVEMHESPQQGAIRELYEETGIIADPKDITLIGSEIVKGYHLTLYTYELSDDRLKDIKLDTNGAFEHTDLKWISSMDEVPGGVNPPTQAFIDQGWTDKIL